MGKMNQNTGYASQRRGKLSEAAARELLGWMGGRMIQKIATPVRLRPPKSVRARKEFFSRVIYDTKVKGDIWGIEPETGRSILAESKERTADRLMFSDLQKHQVEALDEHSDCNGLTYLIWLHPSDVYVMRWPIQGFVPGTSLSVEQARAIKVDRIG